MAQLKLMKKEWFNWFDKTFLANITAWTEYYYINPDSQHWISNNIMDVNDINTETSSGVTYSVKDGEVKLNGTANGQVNITLAYNVNIPAGYKYGAFHLGTIENGNINIYLLEQVVQSPQQLSSWNNTSKTTPTFIGANALSKESKYHLVIVISNGAKLTGYSLKPSLTYGSSSPSVFNPHLIKIEDILKVVSLGDVDWSEVSSPSDHVFRAKLSTNNIKPFPYSQMPGTIFIPGYKVLGWDPIDLSDNLCCAISTGYVNRFSIINHDFSDIDSWKEYVKGKYGIFLKAGSPY